MMKNFGLSQDSGQFKGAQNSSSSEMIKGGGGGSQQPGGGEQAVRQAMSNQDLDYFEKMIKQFQEDLSKPLLQRRAAAMKDDPMEEIHDLYNEIKDHERNFKRVLDITCKIFNFNVQSS